MTYLDLFVIVCLIAKHLLKLTLQILILRLWLQGDHVVTISLFVFLLRMSNSLRNIFCFFVNI